VNAKLLFLLLLSSLSACTTSNRVGSAQDGDAPATEETAAAEGDEVEPGEAEDVAEGEAVEETPELAVEDQTGVKKFRTALEVQADRDASNSFPLVENEFVDIWIRYFTQTKGGRATYAKWLARSTRYEPMIRKVMKEEKLPEDLVYLAMIESGFNPRAASKAAAVGVWQFIQATGRNYDMKIDHWIDERRDIVKATHGAARYLKELHQIFGSWYLAAASYNAGEGRTMRIVREDRSRDFWELIRKKENFRAETRNYVPKIIAAALIAKNREKYGFTDIDFEPLLQWETVDAPPGVDLRTISQLIGADHELMRLMNPELRREITPPDRDAYQLRIPIGKSALYAEKKTELKSRKHGFFLTHSVRRGEVLGSIARRYGIDMRTLMDLNQIRNARHLRIGQQLQIPVDYRSSGSRRSQAAAPASAPETSPTAPKPAPTHTAAVGAGGKGTYVVRRGDTLWSISRANNVTVASLLEANGLRNGRQLKAGMRLAIPGGREPQSFRPRQAAPSKTQKKTMPQSYRVRRGDTLWGLSKRFDIEFSDLLKANNLRKGRDLFAGEKIKIPNGG
jgi:membrane-bound lytic murein transglycosylase D